MIHVLFLPTTSQLNPLAHIWYRTDMLLHMSSETDLVYRKLITTDNEGYINSNGNNNNNNKNSTG